MIAGAIVVALVSRYGFATSDTRLDGIITAFFFAVIATGGIAGPAVATRLFRAGVGWGKVWGVLAGAIAVIALAANLSNSLGAIAGRADKTLAERKAVTDTSRDARTAIARLTSQLDTLEKFTPATADDATAASAAVTAAQKAALAECGDGTDPKKRGERCRAREAEERTARDTLKSTLANKSLTDRAEKLGADLADERGKLAKAPAVSSVNPMAETLARVFRMEADDAATWQQVVTVVVVELLIAFALIAWELLAVEAAPTGTQEREEPAVQEITPPVAALVSPERSSVQRFMLACLPRARGQSAVPMRVIYARYQRWCVEQAPVVEPLEAPAFLAQFVPLCERVQIAMRKKGGKVHCIGVSLAA